MTTSSKQRVSYFYQPDVGHFYYGPSHPMKPHRITMAHHLILSYGLYRKMECYRSHPASSQEMSAFHSEDYINFLSKVNPDNLRLYANHMQRFNVGEYTDCPVFDGLYEFTQLYTGASLDGAVKLNRGDFELLKVHARVLYIDIDVHHGDGVEEAFYCTDRVMTFSLHKYGDFFPGTGHIKDTGAREGTGYSVNAPLTSGMTDGAYERIFKPVMDRIMEVFRPGAVVLQCGADSLTGDRLGCFNLSLKGHGECVRYTKSFNVGEYTDCPVFDGLYEFTQLYTGASLDGAVKLNRGDSVQRLLRVLRTRFQAAPDAGEPGEHEHQGVARERKDRPPDAAHVAARRPQRADGRDTAGLRGHEGGRVVGIGTG